MQKWAASADLPAIAARDLPYELLPDAHTALETHFDAVVLDYDPFDDHAHISQSVAMSSFPELMPSSKAFSYALTSAYLSVLLSRAARFSFQRKETQKVHRNSGLFSVVLDKKRGPKAA